MSDDQALTWEKLALREDLASLIRLAREPYRFQSELAQLLDALYRPGSRVVEVGCFTGITGLLLDDRFDKTMFDLNPQALDLARRLFDYCGKKASFVAGDMFRMPFDEGSFDLVFNSGVLEHFDFGGRVAALKEYGRVLKPGGALVIAFPNHYSVPYRLAYRHLNRTGQWPYPEEFPILDLTGELAAAGLVFQGRSCLDRVTPLHYARRVGPFGLPLKYLFRLIGFEGYLTVVRAQKS